MDAILEGLATLVLNWRIGLALVMSVGLAIILANTVSWITGAYGLALVLVGLGLGFLWHIEATSKSDAVSSREQSKDKSAES